MTFPSILPLAGAAIAPTLGPTLGRIIEGVADGFSFLDALHKQEQDGGPGAVQAGKSSTLEHDFATLADRLRESFARFGIDLQTPLRLKQDGRDHVIVDGDHPDRVLVESICRDDKELTTLFNEVADSAARGRNETDSGVTRQFRLVLGQADAKIEFA